MNTDDVGPAAMKSGYCRQEGRAFLPGWFCTFCFMHPAERIDISDFAKSTIRL